MEIKTINRAEKEYTNETQKEQLKLLEATEAKVESTPHLSIERRVTDEVDGWEAPLRYAVNFYGIKNVQDLITAREFLDRVIEAESNV